MSVAELKNIGVVVVFHKHPSALLFLPIYRGSGGFLQVT
jgi:hypothetical protein